MGSTKRTDRQEKQNRNTIDGGVIAMVVILLLFGLVMLYSTTSYNAQIKYGDSMWFVRKQILAMGIGIAAAIMATFIPTKVWKTGISTVLYLISVAMVFLVLTPLGIESNGARRWFELASFSVQPAELVKCGLILFMAMFISKYKEVLSNLRAYILGIIFPTIGAAVIGVVTKDLGSAIIVFGIGIIMLLVVVPKTRFIWATLVIAAGGAAALVLTSPFRMERIYAWLDVEKYAGDESYQIMQSLYAIASGGFLGKGLGKGTQKLGFVPESQNDMIYSIVVEELGIMGGLLLLALILLLLWKLMELYKESEDTFGKMLIVGVVSHIGIQTFINTAVVTGLIPNTGVPLPFISYGGSQVIVILIEIGLVMSVARERPAALRPLAQRRMENAGEAQSLQR